jgi:hypothetical protein
MRPQDEQIKNSGEKYKLLADSFKADVSSSAPSQVDKVDRGIRSRRLANVRLSKVPQLYNLFKKNADTILKAPSNFSAIPINRKTNILNSSQFPNAPKLYKSLHDNHESLMTLIDSTISSTDSNGNTVNDCLYSRDFGMTEHEYIKKMKTLDRFKPQEIRKLGICSSPECYDCIDCHRHQNELHNALAGIWDDNDADGHQRVLHVKNLISTLNSWSSHMDSRGMDSDRFNDNTINATTPAYRRCAENHQLLATGMRSIARKITEAFEKDGVGIHDDKIQGDNQEAGY